MAKTRKTTGGVEKVAKAKALKRKKARKRKKTLAQTKMAHARSRGKSDARERPQVRHGSELASEASADFHTVTEQPEIKLGNRVFRTSTTGKRKLPVLPDMPDLRDRIYRPHLRALHPAIYPHIAFPVLDQGDDSSCTGFALAHVVDFLRHREVISASPKPVSARMLYEMAKRNDEWQGSSYEGSSIRGAIKGFFRNGVCTAAKAPDKPGMKSWALTVEMAKEARDMRLGAYFRLEPDLADYHAALNEVGAIYASAQIHSNWDTVAADGKIEPGGDLTGGHAFAIVGYDAEGFWILNSWGPEWARRGLAHWRYEDWAATVMDAWVLQLGVRAPSAFGATAGRTPSSMAGLLSAPEPHRADIVGHFINIDDGRLVEIGKYGSPTPDEMRETVDRLAAQTSNSGNGYQHLVIYAHGGLVSHADEARRIAAWARNDIFGRNGIYHFHLMWGSGLFEEGLERLANALTGRAGGALSDLVFEVGLGQKIGTDIWRGLKRDARAAFEDIKEYDGGFRGLKPLLHGLDQTKQRPKLHLVGHSAGAIVLGHLLSAWPRFGLTNIGIESIHLMAPACTVDFFETHFGPAMKAVRDKIYIYNLTDTLELTDKVSSGIVLLPRYSRSLLYLVSRAYEEKLPAPLAGMQIYDGGIQKRPKLSIRHSVTHGVSEARTHGGFDNDAATLTSIMAAILGGPVGKPPQPSELTGY